MNANDLQRLQAELERIALKLPPDSASRRVAHVLRASFASHLLRMGTPVAVVRDLLGHESIDTTNVYLAIEPEERRRAVELL